MSCIRLALRQSGVMRDNDRLKHLPPDELCWIQSGYSPITVFSDDPYYTASITLEFQRGRNDGVGKARDRHERAGPGADQPADKKRTQHVYAERRAWLLLFYIFIVFFSSYS